jgi:hypothetical protein
MKLSEYKKIVPIVQDGDLSSTVTCDSINMRDYLRATFVFTFGTLGTASSVMTVVSGASDAASSSTLYFDYAFGGAAIGTAVAGSTSSCDVLGAWTNAATLTITYSTYSNYMLVVEVEGDKMDRENDEEWLTVIFTDPGTATGTVDGFAILEPRYTGNRSATALA